MYSFLIAGVALVGAFRIWLELRQRANLFRQRHESVPEWADAAGIDRAIAGALSRSSIAIAGIVAETALALVLSTMGIPALGQSQQLASLWPVVGAVALSALCLLMLGTVRRAVELANVLFVDASLGLGRPPLPILVRDTFTKVLIVSVSTLPLLIAAAITIEARMASWWIAVWGFWLGLLVLDHALRPQVMTHLLYAATPLADEALAARIGQVLRGCGLVLGRVMVLDASRRTRRANASVHGVGPQKQIYLHDMLLDRLKPAEILAVVAHEAGHVQHGHALRLLTAQAMLGFAAAFAAAVLCDTLDGSTAERLGLIVVLAPTMAFLARPVLFGLSRRFEYEADAFAAAHTSPRLMGCALKRLYAANSGVATSDYLHGAFHATHPVARDRLARLRAHEGPRNFDHAVGDSLES